MIPSCFRESALANGKGDGMGTVAWLRSIAFAISTEDA